MLYRVVLLVVSLALAGGFLLSAPGTTPVRAQESRYFPETGFSISDDAFWDYFQRRGGVRTFGYPVSRPFQFLGFKVQFFQRQVMQLLPDGSVTTMNILDEGLMPYTRINGSVFPAPDPEVTSQSPAPGSPGYDEAVYEFVRGFAPNSWEGHPVNFYRTFLSTVRFSDAFPDGIGDPNLVPGFNLEMWGVPISKPQVDPTNHDFVYLRFQRGIMHYDASCECTQGLLLADYLKSILTGQNLPADLEEQARTSRFYRQYDNGAANGVRRPEDLPGTNMKDAFEREPAPGSSTPPPTTSGPYRARSPEYGASVFLWNAPLTTDRDLGKLNELGFGWAKELFQWRFIEPEKGRFNWGESDRIVQAANARGIKLLARLDFQPGWARADGAFNGPPDNYEDFANFVYHLVDRYKTGSPHGRLHAIEIWNEPNLAREWSNQPINQQQAADYVRLLRLAYQAAKRADPNVTVVTAGLSPTGWNDDTARPDDVYLQWLYDAGMKGWYDVLGVHGNSQAPDPTAAPGSLERFGHGSFYFRRVEQLREIMVRNGDGDKQIWLLEFGWTSDPIHQQYSWFAISEEQKAENIVKAFRWAHDNWSPWIGVMFLWNIAAPDWGPEREEYWWSITNPDGSGRPAYFRLLDARRSGYLP